MRIFNSSIVRRRWTNWMIASVVVLGLGESKLIGLVTFDGFTSSFQASFQSKRAEQKTPRDLNNPAQTLTARESACGQPRAIELWRRDFVAVLTPQPWNDLLCLPVHSYESPRAPPRGGLI
jgi:hypothetical protein